MAAVPDSDRLQRSAECLRREHAPSTSGGVLDAACSQQLAGSQQQQHRRWGDSRNADLRGASWQSRSQHEATNNSLTDNSILWRQLHSVTNTSPACRDCNSRQVNSRVKPALVSPCSTSSVYRSLTDARDGSRQLHGEAGGSGASAGSATTSGPAPKTWLDRHCPRSLLPYAQLIRMDKPIGKLTLVAALPSNKASGQHSVMLCQCPHISISEPSLCNLSWSVRSGQPRLLRQHGMVHSSWWTGSECLPGSGCLVVAWRSVAADRHLAAGVALLLVHCPRRDAGLAARRRNAGAVWDRRFVAARRGVHCQRPLGPRHRRAGELVASSRR